MKLLYFRKRKWLQAVAAMQVLFIFIDGISNSYADDTCTLKKRTAVDCIVQSDATLSALNNEVSEDYKQNLAALDKPSQKAFEDLQKHWLSSRAIDCNINKANSSNKEQIANIRVCLKKYYQNRITVLTERCEQDKNNTIADMAEWKNPWSNKIPAGFKIEQHRAIYIADYLPPHYQIPQTYNLPSTKLHAAQRTGFGLKPPTPIFSICRIQSEDKKWWIVFGWETDSLQYILESDVTPASVFYTKRD